MRTLSINLLGPVLFVIIFCNISCSGTKNDLEGRFVDPPQEYRPYVWWHWMGSNFSKDGITSDLEAMKESGIGGATIFNLSSAVQESHAPVLNNPWPEQTYRSQPYWEALRHAALEAERLGLEIGLHNTVGYSTTGGPWVDEERSMQHLVWSDTIMTGGCQLSLKLRMPELVADEGWGATGRVLSYYKDIVVLAVPFGKTLIGSEEVINLTSCFDSLSWLNWEAPSGKWLIYRIGHASTGRPPHPVPDDLLGKVLEADKMSAEQSQFHWDNVIDPLKEHIGDYIGTSFKHILIDSYEAGNQNWTPLFREEFIRRKGYDPIPWLASFSLTTGTENNSRDRRFIESEEQTKRFDRDYLDVIVQLFSENGWNIGKKKIEEAGLQLQFEPYGGPFNTPDGVALADLPMAEFWTGKTGGIYPDVPAAARAAGKTVVGAEAFTGWPTLSQYTEDPAFLKPSADKAFASGINKLILHHWVHQPFNDRYRPGMGMGWWGTHFGRHQTWFEPGKAFFKWISRCQVLLQYGEQVSDFLCVDKLIGSSDMISTRSFLYDDIKVENGNIVLPSGRNYPFIVFSDTVMLPEVAAKIRALVSNGATIVSPKPVASPSLKNYPHCDEEVIRIADEVWGNNTGNKFGKGSIYTILSDAITGKSITSDHIIEQADHPDELKLIHRHSPDADIWFIANLSEERQKMEISFRISGKQPELWNAENGTISKVAVWVEKQGMTRVMLNLKGMQSAFIVFRKPAPKSDHPVSISVSDTDNEWDVLADRKGGTFFSSYGRMDVVVNYSSGKQKKIRSEEIPGIEINGPWKVAFASKTDSSFELNFPELVDLSRHPDNAVAYFSGTAIYSKKVTLEPGLVKDGQRIILDLGELNDIAEVRVNGKNVGVLWYPPYSVDITDFLLTGENDLSISVTNNWANRLIGDESEPTDFEWGKDRGEEFGRAMLSYPDWFLSGKPRPSHGRKAFTIWYYYRPGSQLMPAGLAGPVNLRFGSVVSL